MDKMMFLLSEGVKNLWRHKLTAFTAIFSTFLTLSVAGSLMIVGQNTNKVIEYLRGKYKIEVFFNENVPDKQIATVVEEFNKINGVRSTTLISRSDAGKIFKSQFGENILDIVKKNDYALLDGSFFNNAELPHRDMSEIPHPFLIESMTKFESLSTNDKTKIHFIHLNHTNPALIDNSNETIQLKKNGFQVASLKQVFLLSD